jgi:hypothetical protein
MSFDRMERIIHSINKEKKMQERERAWQERQKMFRKKQAEREIKSE